MHKVSDAVRSTHGQDGGIVIDLRCGTMFAINLVGSKILQLLACGTAEGDIAAEIGREFQISEELARAHVDEFIEILTQNHVVEHSESGLATSSSTEHVP